MIVTVLTTILTLMISNELLSYVLCSKNDILIKDFSKFLESEFGDEIDFMITTIDNKIRFRVDFKNNKKTYCNEFDKDISMEEFNQIMEEFSNEIKRELINE